MTESKKVRVLIADNDKLVRNLIKAVLMPLDCEIVGEAENGSEAVALYKGKRPDIVLLDVNMPVMDGMEALGEIIAFDKDAVVIMLTAISDLDTVQTAIKRGAAHYIVKGTPPQEMRDIVKEHLPKPKSTEEHGAG
ncbi:MAG: response regulator [Xanthomonadaceae bacterium]|jgi:two-component system chemotaxis response regulator CheY|nr:response regulator [Xanthomonadaceae bacterium]